MPLLSGRVAVVTGASSGIGRATAVALGAQGAHVVLVARDAGRLDAARLAVEAARGPGSALSLPLDVGSEADMAALPGAVLDRFGAIDILVAAAGVYRAPHAASRLPGPLVRMPVEDWDGVLRVNLRGVYLSNRAVIPSMMARRTGWIINVGSSRAALYGQPHAAAYCASKFGLMGLTEALAEELRPHGIAVTALLPDVVDTPMLGDAGRARLGPALPPERVAEVVLRLVTLPADTRLVHPLIAPQANPARPFGAPWGGPMVRAVPGRR